MKIKIDLNVSQTSSRITISLSDLGLTEDQWNAMDEGEKNDAIQYYVNELPEQPYWAVSSFWED